MADADESVLKTALPPATDYLAYLTILEYNLDKDELPLLHQLLQDEKLVTNIGWDLVHLLIPLLPDSRPCLEDVASLGNPREVILKVIEELDSFQSPDADPDGESDGEEHSQEAERPARNRQSAAEKIQVFESLLHMLCMLHPRIRTKKPSRFLETSVFAILGAYKTIAASADATRAVLMFLKTMSGSSRPSLPPRSGEPAIPIVASHTAAPDPEANQDGSDEGEAEAMSKLLQALISHLIEMHLNAVATRDDAVPMSWSERFFESKYPEKILPGARSATASFNDIEALRLRDLLVNQMLNAASMELHIDWNYLVSSFKNAKRTAESDESTEGLTSRPGILCLMAAHLQRRGSAETGIPTLSYSDSDRITTAIMGDPQVGLNTDLSAATIDAMLRICWRVASDPALSSELSLPEVQQEDEGFSTYLQKLSAIAATNPHASIRYSAYLITTSVLESHPSSAVRLTFIRDTARYCPYPNLREVAIGWIQREYSHLSQTLSSAAPNARTASNVFSQDQTLKELGRDLFGPRDLTAWHDLIEEDGAFLQTSLSLLYLLCSSAGLRKCLHVAEVMEELDIEKQYLIPLAEAIKDPGEQQGQPDDEAMETKLLEEGLGLARAALRSLIDEAKQS